MTGRPRPSRCLAAAIVPLVLASAAACGDASPSAGRTVTVTASAVTTTVAPGAPAPTTTTAPATTTSAPATTSTPAPSSSTAGPATPGVADFDKAAGAYLARRKGDYGFAAVDLTNGKQVQHNPGQRCETASMVKLDVLLTLLLQHQDSRTPLSASDRSLATSMIRYSDNAATSTLWRRIGQDQAVRAANKRFGMTETQPGTQLRWGLTTTTAPDQVRLLRNLVKDGPLTAPSREFALGLLGTVSAGQDWGVSAANPARKAQLKNGWLPRAQGWVVTSAGRVKSPAGHDLLVSGISCHGSSQAHSVESIERLSRMAAGALDKG